MKKRFGLILFLFLLCLCSHVIAEDEFTIEKKVLIKYNGDGGEVTVPDGVTVLGEWAFSESDVTIVHLPETLKKIRSWCFFLCSQLTDITLPASLENLEFDNEGDVGQVFGYNDKLQSIKVAPGNTHYTSVNGVLYTADKKKLLYYPAGKNRGGTYSIPEGTEEIGYSSFSGVSLRSVTLPSTLQRFSSVFDFHGEDCAEFHVADGNPCFSSYKGALYEGSTLLGYPSARTATKLTAADFMPGVTRFADYAFQFNSYVKEVEIPDKVTEIGWWCFDGVLFEKITVPSSVTHISKEAFYNCPSLKVLIIRSPSVKFPNEAVKDCRAVTIYAHSGSTAEAYAKKHKIPFVSLEACPEPTVEPYLEVGDSITADGLKYKITAMKTVSFTGLEKAKSKVAVEIPATVTYADTTFNVTEIDAKAMYKDTRVTKVSIGKNVKSIGKNAFASCTKLTTVNGCANVTSIGESAFSGDTNLTGVDLGKKLSSIEKNAFAKCKKIAKVNYAGKYSQWKKIKISGGNDDLTAVYYAPTNLKLNRTSVTLTVSKTLQLKATMEPDYAQTPLTWASSNKKVATVSAKGLVKAVGKGTATITVKTGNGLIAKVKIKVR